MSFCPHCSARIEPADRFCPSCGKPVVVQQPVSPPDVPVSVPAPPHTPASPAKRGRVGLIISAGCLTLIVALAALVVLVLMLTSGGTDAARDQLSLLVSGDVETAYQKTSPAFRKEITLDDFRTLVNSRPLLKQTKSISIPERQMENDIATVTAQLTDGQGVVRGVPMRVRKEGGQWLVIAIDLSAIPAEVARPPVPAPERATNTPALAQPQGKEPGIGEVIIGSGRNENGTLIKPGEKVSRSVATLSADIALLNHPPGGRVRLWIESIASGNKTEPITATIEGAGSGNLPFDLHMNGQNLAPGPYRLVILLGEDQRFVREFEVR